ncbi:MAG: phosphoribosylpyrophosphate synthetase [Betaproteobacteria bacterium HGW-Betaproteobacteria-13]|jgi:ribose-phosphate pyrophosphokinase|uniref:Phosphoribosylpyrophosphate synthetase n=1 Tax=Parazoarcus communis TaxID=41977 RepID=A0A2U8GYR6_9RHOO|nr:ribose-phosphate diphosphokinase [Parazoarcus communis]AWI78480.1 phosphoribosylpyrophosphate synthetase [Parazoarcus communis]PKO78965.1 MAG: phosphoribosylpyrophosphate synthetase [Betaproteobacteria bacterium HGW-Betaproteobacteria-13]
MIDLLLCFEDEQPLAARLAEAAGVPCEQVARHRFPDGELKLRLPPALPPRVGVLRGLDHPNEKLVELLLCARAARTLGAGQLVLIAPYLGYMRQDIAFAPGEVVSQRVVGEFLASLFDAVLTVDPHLHRVSRLSEAVPVAQALALSAAPLLAELIAARRPGALLLGPDAEAAQWVAAAAQSHAFDHGVCSKQRHGDREVHVTLPDMAFAGRQVVLIDDVASSGHTLAVAAAQLLAAGAASVDVAVTHALFADNALQTVHAAGVGAVWSTDCIAHPSNAVGVAPMLAQALRSLK